jgi:PKD domain-containing protein/transglycosylase-like protein with SLT domain
MPVWTSRKQRLAVASVVIASALGLGGASVTAHRVGAAPAQNASSGSASVAPNGAAALAGGGGSDPTSPLPPTSSPGGPSHTPEPTPTAPSAPQLAADGIPAVALDAYRKAAASVAGTHPGCGLPWPLLAAIGRVESDHGRFAGSQLYTDGSDAPRVIGIPLNGQGTALIRDTDHGLLDGDTVYDRAVGPMQFIPSTWATWGVDGNGDGTVSPFNIYDAALAAADYLCSAGGNLQTAAGQIRAVLAYNHSDAYLATVLALEKIYAAGQPGVTIPILPSVPKPPAHENPPLPPPVNPGPPLALAPAPTSTSPSRSASGTSTGPGSGTGSTSSPTSSSSGPSAPPSSSSSPPPPSSPGAPPSSVHTPPPTTSTPPSSSPSDTPPIAALSVSVTNGVAPLDVIADASASTDDNGITGYTFDFGDGTPVVAQDKDHPTATHTYQSAGTYQVTVRVTDTANRSTTSLQVTVTVTAPSSSSSSSTTSGYSTPASTAESSSTSSQTG